MYATFTKSILTSIVGNSPSRCPNRILSEKLGFEFDIDILICSYGLFAESWVKHAFCISIRVSYNDKILLPTYTCETTLACKIYAKFWWSREIFPYTVFIMFIGILTILISLVFVWGALDLDIVMKFL